MLSIVLPNNETKIFIIFDILIILLYDIVYCLWTAFDKKESSIRVQVALCSRQLSCRQSASQPVQSLSPGQVSGSRHEQGRSVQPATHKHTSISIMKTPVKLHVRQTAYSCLYHCSVSDGNYVDVPSRLSDCIQIIVFNEMSISRLPAIWRLHPGRRSRCLTFN